MVATIRRFGYWVGDLFEIMIIPLVIVGAIVLLIVGVVSGIGYVERRNCFESTEQIGVDADWGFWSGCRVNTGDELVPLDNYRVTEVPQ